MKKFKVRWKVPALCGDEWQYGPNEFDDLEAAKADARDVGGFEGVGPVEVYRDEGDVGVIEWALD
jgi:hypothetical protein